MNQIEPSATSRTLAREMRDMFVAFVQEGFTEEQALRILAEITRAHIANLKGS